MFQGTGCRGKPGYAAYVAVCIAASVTSTSCSLKNKADAIVTELTGTTLTSQSLPNNANSTLNVARIDSMMDTNEFLRRSGELFPNASSTQANMWYSGKYRFFNDDGSYNTALGAFGGVGAGIFAASRTILGQNSRSISTLHYIGMTEFIDYMCTSGGYLENQAYSTGVPAVPQYYYADYTQNLYDETRAKTLLPSSYNSITDKDVKMALVAASNAWQSSFNENSDEIKILAQLFRDVRAGAITQKDELGKLYTSDGAQNLAKKAVCITLIEAPQFWLGSPDVLGPFNRLAQRLGNRDLSDAEKQQILSKQLTLTQFMRNLRTEAGFKTTLRGFVNNWLGLGAKAFARNFIQSFGAGAMIENATQVRLNGTIEKARFDKLQAPDGSITAMDQQHIDMGVLVPGTTWDGPHLNAIGCTPPVSDVYAKSSFTNPIDYYSTWQGQAYSSPRILKEQAFNPDTSYLIWDIYNIDTHAFETVGGWVQDVADAKAAYTAQMTSAYGWTGFTIAANCIPAASDPLSVAGWIRCNGHVKDVANNTYVNADLTSTNLYNATIITKDGSTVRVGGTNNVLPASVAAFLHKTEMLDFGGTNNMLNLGKYRYHRFARSVHNTFDEQNGYSKVYGYFSNQPFYVCNAVDRFAATCAYHPPKARAGSRFRVEAVNGMGTFTDPDGRQMVNPGIANTRLAEFWTPAYRMVPSDGYFHHAHSQYWAHPELLSTFRCGTEDPNQFQNPDTPFNEPAAYPLVGSDPNHPYHEIATNYISASSATYSGCPSNHPECHAQGDLSQELSEEPQRLFWDTVENHRDFRLILTADYTFLKPHAELFIRGGNRGIGVRPPEWTPPANAAEVDTVRRISASQLNGLTWKHFVHWAGVTNPITNPGDVGQLTQLEYQNSNLIYTTNVRPKSMCGVICMSGFLQGMAWGSARSVPARIFLRILGLDPSQVDGSFDQTTGKADPVQQASFTALTHLPGKQGQAFSDHVKNNTCMICHINMDPLGAAFFNTYGTIVSQSFSPSESLGSEMWGPGLTYYGGEPGTGAFLKQPVKGMAEVAQVAANSRYFATNVVKKLFVLLFDRDPDINEMLGYINPATDWFMDPKRGNYDFYLLMEYMVNQGPFTSTK